VIRDLIAVLIIWPLIVLGAAYLLMDLYVSALHECYGVISYDLQQLLRR